MQQSKFMSIQQHVNCSLFTWSSKTGRTVWRNGRLWSWNCWRHF